MYEPYWRLCFEFKEFIPAISLSGNIFDIKWAITDVFFGSVSPELFSLEHSGPDISLFSIWILSFDS